MSRFQLDLAAEADDAALRRVLARTPTGGHISVAFRREPSFFAAAAVDGRFRQVIVGRDREAEGEIVGLGSRSIREAYVNGRAESIGYLSSLRLLPEYRRWGSLVARGFRYFRELHADGRARLYLTTIAEGNERALEVLTRARPPLPTYHYAGRFLTAAIPLRAKRSGEPRKSGGISVRAATKRDAGDIVSFLRANGPVRQFFPVYGEEDFSNDEGVFRGLRFEDILLAHRGGRLVGTLATWDQHAYRQSIVNGYSRAIRLGRPFYNGWARFTGLPPLPNLGEPIRYLTAAFPVVADGESESFELLLQAMLDAKAGGEAQYLMLGLHESDPLLSIVRRRRATWYTTRLYLVCWDDGEELRRGLDARAPYLELGTL